MCATIRCVTSRERSRRQQSGSDRVEVNARVRNVMRGQEVGGLSENGRLAASHRAGNHDDVGDHAGPSVLQRRVSVAKTIGWMCGRSAGSRRTPSRGRCPRSRRPSRSRARGRASGRPSGSNTMPPIAPPKPTRPATEATMRRWKRSVGTIITSVDHDCWPKNAMLKSTIASSTGTWVTKMMSGITAALAPSAILRAELTDAPAREQPAREPAADQAADAGRGIRDPRVVADLLHVEAARVVEILRQPEEVEVPGGVGEELRHDETPDLAEPQQAEPGHRRGWPPAPASDFADDRRARRRTGRGCCAGG